MIALNKKKMEEFLKLAGQRLEGDWVLLGGTLLPVLGMDHRVTVDIDLAHRDKDTSQALELLRITDEMGLPIETINQAGGFFLYQLKGFEKKLELLHKGPQAKIHRPNLELYFQLKLQRFSDTDAQDCLQYLNWYRKNQHPVDTVQLTKLLNTQLRKTTSATIKERISSLLDQVAG